MSLIKQAANVIAKWMQDQSVAVPTVVQLQLKELDYMPRGLDRNDLLWKLLQQPLTKIEHSPLPKIGLFKRTEASRNTLPLRKPAVQCATCNMIYNPSLKPTLGQDDYANKLAPVPRPILCPYCGNETMLEGYI
jgi:hypothetical protein